jgi:uncharacterized RDD family membrane protein YckC
MAFNWSVFEMVGHLPAEFPPALVIFAIAFALIILLSVLLFIAWIWMIVDVAKRDRFRTGDRVVWILLLVLTGLIGMALYYFLEMRRRKQ